MDFITGTAAGLNQGIYAGVSRYRRKMFMETLGWQLDSPPGEECGQFDRPDTVYVEARNDEDKMIGCARLLPTQSPYLLAEVFPQLLRRAGLSACRAGPLVIVDGPLCLPAGLRFCRHHRIPAEQRRADVQLTDFR